MQCRRRPLQCTLSTKTHGSKTDVSKPTPLAVARKQFLHSLVPSASPLTVLSSCIPDFTRFTWDSISRHSDEEWLLSLDWVPSVARLLHIQRIVTCVHGCTPTASTVMKPSRASVGECDSMPRSGSEKPLIMSLAFARRPDGLLSSGFQVRGPAGVHSTIRPARPSLGRFFQR